MGRSVAAALALALSMAAACEASGSIALAPGEFRIRRSTAPEPIERREATLGIVTRKGLTLPDQIALAWGVSRLDLELRMELPAGAFDVSGRAIEGGLPEADALIRGGLAQHLGLRVRAVTRPRGVFVLRRVRGAPPPEPAGPGVTGLSEDSSAGRYRGGGQPISHLVDYLGRFARRPIVDETGLTGTYDVVLEWDPEGGALALRDALAEAGFVLASAGRPRLTYIVEPQPPGPKERE